MTPKPQRSFTRKSYVVSRSVGVRLIRRVIRRERGRPESAEEEVEANLIGGIVSISEK